MGGEKRGRWSGALESEAFTLAAKQHGLVTREQLHKLGASSRTLARRLKSKLWERFLPGVYRLLPPPRSEWHTLLMGACLWLGDGAFASHAAAARLHGLDGFSEETPVHVSVPWRHNHRVRRGMGLVVHCVRDVPEKAIGTLDGIPVARPWLALLEVAGSEPEDSVDAALDCALRRNLVGAKDLQMKLGAASRCGVPGVRTLRKLLLERAGTRPKDSENERWFYKHVIQPYGLPKPVHNFEVHGPDGYHKVDAGYPQFAISIELHSKKHHTSIAKVKADSEKQNKLVLAGLTPLVFWWEEVRYRPAEVAEKIWAAISWAEARAA